MGKRRGIEIPDTATRILGIDTGLKKWGISISDTAHRVAFPHGILSVRSNMAEVLLPLIQEYNIVTIVLGIPEHLTGQANPRVQHIYALGEHLSQELSMPVEYADERLSTATAQEYLQALSQHPNKNDDDLAAQVVLQRYLDRKTQGE